MALIKTIEKMPATIYHHSWSASDIKNTAGARWWQRLQQRQGLGTVTNNAVYGQVHFQQLERALNGQNNVSAWTPGTGGIVFIGAGVAEQDLYGNSATALQGKTVEDAMLCMLLLLSSGGAWDESTGSFTFGGSGWATQSDVNYKYGTRKYTSVVNDYVEFTAPGPAFSIMEVPVDGSTWRGMNYSVSIDGVVQGGTYYGGRTQDAASYAQVGHRAIQFWGLSGSNHTVRLTATSKPSGATTAYLGVDAVLTPSAHPPLIVVLKEPRIAALSDATHYAYWSNAIDNAVTAAALGTNVVKVDLNTGFDEATMIGDDNLHPNDKGESFIADAVETALASQAWSWGLNTLST